MYSSGLEKLQRLFLSGKSSQKLTKETKTESQVVRPGLSVRIGLALLDFLAVELQHSTYALGGDRREP